MLNPSSSSKINNINVGNIEENFDVVKDADWVVEAVVERIDIKHNIYEKIFKNRKKGAIVSSNTSSIPIKVLSEKLNDEEQKLLDALLKDLGDKLKAKSS